MNEEKPDVALASQIGGTHYTEMALQPWEAFEYWLSIEEYRGYLRASALSYLIRAGKKGSYGEDIAKAKHCLERLLEIIQE